MYLDARGLVALWREALLAQAVLRGRTMGYRHHPQLVRFREQPSPVGSIADYLRGVHAEAASRGYRFGDAKISRSGTSTHPTVTRGQLDYEWQRLLTKLKVRDRKRYAQLMNVTRPRAHPLFRVVRGAVAPWEKVG